MLRRLGSQCRDVGGVDGVADLGDPQGGVGARQSTTADDHPSAQARPVVEGRDADQFAPP